MYKLLFLLFLTTFILPSLQAYAEDFRFYQVKEGDTLSKIAKKFGLYPEKEGVEALFKLNKFTVGHPVKRNPDHIWIGVKIKIPTAYMKKKNKRVKKSIGRSIASVKTSNTKKTIPKALPKEDDSRSKFQLLLRPYFFITKYDSTDKRTDTNAKVFSELSGGLEFSYAFSLEQSWKFRHGLSFEEIKMKKRGERDFKREVHQSLASHAEFSKAWSWLELGFSHHYQKEWSLYSSSQRDLELVSYHSQAPGVRLGMTLIQQKDFTMSSSFGYRHHFGSINSKNLKQEDFGLTWANIEAESKISPTSTMSSIFEFETSEQENTNFKEEQSTLRIGIGLKFKI